MGDLLHKRGIEVNHGTVRFWWMRFGPMFASEIRRKRVDDTRRSRWRWHLDEVFVKINGVQHSLSRAVDHKGEVLEAFIPKTRDRKSALTFLRKLMGRYGADTERSLSTRHTCKQALTAAFAEWRALCAA